MASISTRPNGSREIQFADGNGGRRTVRLGKVPMKDAREIRRRVELLNAARTGNTSPDAETAAWVAGTGDVLHARLAAAGLVESRARSGAVTLAAYWAEFVAGKKLKPRSRVAMDQVLARAEKFFGPGRLLAEVLAGDAERFADWLRSKYAQATAARTLKRIKQVYARAVKDEAVPANPFDGIVPGGMSNPKRLRYVTAAEIAQVLDVAPGPEWRAVIALARFAGLRIPSELVGLTWADVNVETRRIVVRSPKLEHSASGGVRVVPIFPELKPHLEALFDAAVAREALVCPKLSRVRSGNLRTPMRRLIERAGLVPWERTFQNLRASFDIDLHERFPAHVAASWAGHTEKTARGHYLQVQEEHFARATTQALQNALRHGTAPTCTDVKLPSEIQRNSAGCIPVQGDEVAPA
ncbi:MAG TPA: tyrosine-type recombinase/integrase [Gemmataceae bacterium]|nr:tyrosine-type recombinase/integrase [Gemmataceae bacterium]